MRVAADFAESRASLQESRQQAAEYKRRAANVGDDLQQMKASYAKAKSLYEDYVAKLTEAQSQRMLADNRAEAASKRSAELETANDNLTKERDDSIAKVQKPTHLPSPVQPPPTPPPIIAPPPPPWHHRYHVAGCPQAEDLAGRLAKTKEAAVQLKETMTRAHKDLEARLSHAQQQATAADKKSMKMEARLVPGPPFGFLSWVT